MTYVLLIAVALLVFAGVSFLRRRAAGGQANSFTDNSDAHLHRNQNDMTTGVIVGGLVAGDAVHSQPADDAGSWGAMSDSSGSFDGGSSGSFDGGSTSID